MTINSTEMFLIVCCVAFLCSLVLQYIYIKLYTSSDRNSLRDFSGPPTFPFLGNVLQFLVSPEDIHDVFARNFKKYGNIWTCWIFNKPTLMTSDPRLAQIVLGSYTHLEKHFMYDYGVKIIFGENGLPTMDVHKWMVERKTYNKLFNSEYLEDSFQQCKENWANIHNEISGHHGIPLDSLALFRKVYFKLLLQSFDADPTFCTNEVITSIEEQFVRGLNLINIRLMKPWTRNPLYWKLFGYERQLNNLHTVLKEIFKSQVDRYCATADSTNSTDDLPVGLKETTSEPKTVGTMKSFLTDRAIPFDVKYDNVITGIAAAVDTSAIAMTMTLFYLANYPACQLKAQQEVDKVFDQYGDLTQLKMSDVFKLNYLRQCIKEALRLHPPVPAIGRTTTEDITLDDGRKIPSGTGILFLFKEMQRSPANFSNPEVFNPERFAEEKYIKPCTFIPFSYGPRNCIGKKYSEGIIPALLSLILRHYTVRALQSPKEIKLLYEIAGTPHPNVQLIFEKRNC